MRVKGERESAEQRTLALQPLTLAVRFPPFDLMIPAAARVTRTSMPCAILVMCLSQTAFLSPNRVFPLRTPSLPSSLTHSLSRRHTLCRMLQQLTPCVRVCLCVDVCLIHAASSVDQMEGRVRGERRLPRRSS